MKICTKHGHHLGIFLALVFILSFIWYWIHPVQQQLRMDILQLLFFGFQEMDLASFISGLVQSYIWGYIFMVLYCISSFCACGCCKKKS